MTMMGTEPAVTDLSGEVLRARVARAQMYIITASSAGGAKAPTQEQTTVHHRWLQSIETLGLLHGYGALERVEGDDALEMAVIVASSREEAERIAADDPWHQAGVRSNSVRGHTMNEGVACYFARALSRRAIAGGGSYHAGAVDHSFVSNDGEAAQLYLIHLVSTEKARPAEDMKTMDAHFVWLRENEMAAKLMTCGPIEAPAPLAPGIWGGGMGVVATSAPGGGTHRRGRAKRGRRLPQAMGSWLDDGTRTCSADCAGDGKAEQPGLATIPGAAAVGLVADLAGARWGDASL